MRNGKKTVFFAALLCAWSLSAADSDSYEHFNKGSEREKTGKFLTAAGDFLEAQVQADDPVLKANALMNAARCYRKAEQYGAEFDCLQKLAKGHLGRINYAAVVQRQYEIADEYFNGHRDYFVSWLPFVKKDDRTAEIFKAVLENAPCAADAPEIRLRLGRIYMDEQKPDDAASEFIKTIKLYPKTVEAKYAALELANVFMQQSKRGDGDGRHAKDALEAFDTFLKEHPADTETEWIRRSRDQVNSYIADRYCKLGEFYRSAGKNETAERYFALVLRDYPQTPEAAKAEKQLSELDSSFASSGKKWTPRQREFKMQSLPPDANPVLVLPGDSDGRWLLPVRDMRSGLSEPVPEKLKDEVSHDSL